MEKLDNYRLSCTLTFGDIYGQIIVWLIVIFLSLASALALWSTERQVYALLVVGLIVVVSLPFLLFAFVTTLLNHIEVNAVDPAAESSPKSRLKTAARQKPAQATGT